MSNEEYRKGANAILVKDNKFLLVQKMSYADNQWDFPGGGIDDGESPEKGILRELEEELGASKFKIHGISSVVNKYDWPDESVRSAYKKHRKYWKGQEKYQFLVLFNGDLSDIKSREGEIRAIKWVTKDQLKEHLVFKNQWDITKACLDDFENQGLLP